MKVAFVYDRVTKWGGAERVLLALHELWPDAPLYTAVYDKKNASWADIFVIHPSFLTSVPFAQRAHELFSWATPMAFESFSFDDYDMVISITSAEAKSILTKPQTIHLCYCLTPTRYLWSGYSQYVDNPGLGILSSMARWALQLFAPRLKQWDLVSATRPDYYVAISKRVKERIVKYYHRSVHAVVYPPVDTEKFKPARKAPTIDTQAYFLVVSRLVSYKRIDLIIYACNTLGVPLVVIGRGRQYRQLRRIAGPTITIVHHHLTDSELVRYYQGCAALVFAGDEDFGLVSVEAQACGKPVICYRDSGMAETVIDGITGILYDSQRIETLVAAIRQFGEKSFDPLACRTNALTFGAHNFKKNMKGVIENIYTANHI